MTQKISIDPSCSVNELIRQYPRTVGVFNDFGIDACCGGASPLTEAAERDGAPLPQLLEALAEAAAEQS